MRQAGETAFMFGFERRRETSATLRGEDRRVGVNSAS